LTLVPLNPERLLRGDDDWGAALGAVGQRQDREAFARLFAQFAPRVKRYLMQGGSPEVQAEELTQEALAMVWRKAALFDPDQAAASTWIFTIARNLRVDALRRRQGLEAAPGAGEEAFDFDLLHVDEPAADVRLDAERLNVKLRGALAQLPREQLQVLRLSYYDDEPHARIAAVLGIPLGTVKSRMRLAVAQLRRLLE
jgi:RNA polymerase sigma-70 factor (ECF subfamily)